MSVLVTFAFVSCNKESDKAVKVPDQEVETLASMISENGSNPDEAIMVASTDGATGLTTTNSVDGNRNRVGHFVYTESNEAGTNQIFVYQINPEGSLTLQGSTPSGGAGAGAGLGSQRALVLSGDHEWLFAVNAGSNSVSSFKVHDVEA
jgi:hypothetical protein